LNQNKYITCVECKTRNLYEDAVCGICKAELKKDQISKNQINNQPLKFTLRHLLGLLFGCIIIYNLFIKEASKNNNSFNSSSEYINPKILPCKSIEEFQKKFNAFSLRYNLDLFINDLQIIDGSINNTFTYMFNEHVGIIGALEKTNNEIISITMIGKGDGSLNSGIDILSVITCIIGSIDNTLLPNERKEILEHLGFLDNIDLYNTKDEIIKNGLRYFINSTHETGILCGVEIQ
jgi:hypothetical protein